MQRFAVEPRAAVAARHVADDPGALVGGFGGLELADQEAEDAGLVGVGEVVVVEAGGGARRSAGGNVVGELIFREAYGLAVYQKSVLMEMIFKPCGVT